MARSPVPFERFLSEQLVSRKVGEAEGLHVAAALVKTELSDIGNLARVSGCEELVCRAITRAVNKVIAKLEKGERTLLGKNSCDSTEEG